MYKCVVKYSKQISKVLLCEVRKMSTEMDVKCPSENKLGEAWAYLTGESSSGKGLIVIQEWWGQNQQIKDQGTNIGKDGGFKVLVPDLYRGKVATDAETAGHYMNGLDWQGAVQDIAACARYLQANGCKKVGVTGFCMGGALTFACAALIPDVISAAAPFYGIPPAELADLTKIKIPVEAHFGEEDTVAGFSSKKDYEELRAKLNAAKVPFVLHEYKAGHAFCNPQNRIGPNYKEELANLAMKRLVEFMQKNLD